MIRPMAGPVTDMKKKGIIIPLWIIAAAAVAWAIFAYLDIYHYEQGAAALLPPPSANEAAGPSMPSVDTSEWKTYTSSAFGFSFEYPGTWQNSGDPLTVANPHVFFGNPLSGTTTYRMGIFVYDNPGSLSAEDYVAAMIASDTAEDVRSGAASGTAPRITPQFSREFPLTVAGMPAYELYNVFAFDHNGEQIYVADGSHVILFDFPVADANPNIADPAANNIIAHAIIGTLRVAPGSM